MLLNNLLLFPSSSLDHNSGWAGEAAKGPHLLTSTDNNSPDVPRISREIQVSQRISQQKGWEMGKNYFFGVLPPFSESSQEFPEGKLWIFIPDAHIVVFGMTDLFK